jgi:hypothetical protein
MDIFLAYTISLSLDIGHNFELSSWYHMLQWESPITVKVVPSVMLI